MLRRLLEVAIGLAVIYYAINAGHWVGLHAINNPQVQLILPFGTVDQSYEEVLCYGIFLMILNLAAFMALIIVLMLARWLGKKVVGLTLSLAHKEL